MYFEMQLPQTYRQCAIRLRFYPESAALIRYLRGRYNDPHVDGEPFTLGIPNYFRADETDRSLLKSVLTKVATCYHPFDMALPYAFHSTRQVRLKVFLDARSDIYNNLYKELFHDLKDAPVFPTRNQVRASGINIAPLHQGADTQSDPRPRFMLISKSSSVTEASEITDEMNSNYPDRFGTMKACGMTLVYKQGPRGDRSSVTTSTETFLFSGKGKENGK